MASLTASVLPIDVTRLLSTVAQMEAAGIEYGLGSKATLGTSIGQIKQIDCSGFVRYAIYAASSGSVRMPDGSWFQEGWCRQQGFASCNYMQSAGLNDGAVRIAFLQGTIRHVWLILNGQTMESYGGHGPGRRMWNNSRLTGASPCFLLTPETDTTPYKRGTSRALA
jgi:hypothetical protein